MAQYTDLPLYIDSVKMLITFETYCRKMDRDQRYTNGQRIKQLLTDVIIQIYKACKYPDKTAYLATAQENIVEVQVLLRILNELHQVSDKQYVIMAEQSCGLMKQLAAWEHKSRSSTTI